MPGRREQTAGSALKSLLPSLKHAWSLLLSELRCWKLLRRRGERSLCQAQELPAFPAQIFTQHNPCDEKSLLFSDSFEDIAARSRSASALAETSAVRLTPTALLRKFADSICEMRAALQVKMQQAF